MVLDSQRARADRIIVPLTRPFMNWNPNSVSLLSLVLAAIAGIFIYLSRYEHMSLAPAFIAVLLSSLFDAIDGKLARLKNATSPRGDLIDHVFDRYADIFLLLGIIFSGLAQLSIGIAALTGVMLTSYMGVQSQALNLKRNYSGILGRADRLVFIMVFIIIELVFPFKFTISSLLVTPMSVLLIWFGVAGNATAVKRFFDSYRALAPS